MKHRSYGRKVILRILMYQYFRIRGLKYTEYIGWVAGEIFFMALVYTLMEEFILNDPRDFITAFKKSVEVTALALILPYSMLWLYFAWRENTRRLHQISGTDHSMAGFPKMIHFYDEKRILRFSVKKDDLLYLEAADNYVTIHYLDQLKRSKYMVRSTLKRIEESLSEQNLVRCHRSYMVNFDKVKIVRKEKDGLHLELDIQDKLSLLVSKTYVDQVMKRLTGVPG